MTSEIRQEKFYLANNYQMAENFQTEILVVSAASKLTLSRPIVEILITNGVTMQTDKRQMH